MPGQRLMEHAGAAVAAAVKAIAEATERWTQGPDPDPVRARQQRRRRVRRGALPGAGRRGGRGGPRLGGGAARRRADAGRNWNRLDREPRVTRIHAALGRSSSRSSRKDIERASVVVDALLGTGVQRRAARPDPLRGRARPARRAKAKVPIVAVDTPTAVDLTSGDPSDPVVRADLTVTFHRPKTGLLHDARRARSPARCSWRRSASRRRPTVADSGARPRRLARGPRSSPRVAVGGRAAERRFSPPCSRPTPSASSSTRRS